MANDDHHGITELDKAGKQRMVDAQALLSSDRWRCAMNIAGYSIECLLKTKLMRKFDCRNLRELETYLLTKGIIGANTTVFTHQLQLLLRLCKGLNVFAKTVYCGGNSIS